MNKMWCLMLQLSMNMWNDSQRNRANNRDFKFELELSCDKKVWDEATEFAAASGCNSVLIDLGDGIQYESHPELAIKGAWDRAYLKQELIRLRGMGLTPYPKLNFSTGHDAWLHEYSRMVSTPIYYKVCKDLIHEVIDLFDNPEYFHLGMDEENAHRQRWFDFVCYRQFDLLWNDVNFLLDCVREKGVTPWIWADLYWDHPEEFKRHVGKDVLVSPWYYCALYGDANDPLPTDSFSVTCMNSYRELSDLGYNIVPSGSNFVSTNNFDHLHRFSLENINEEQYKGFLIAPWVNTNDKYKYTILEAIQLAKYIKEEYEN